MNDIETANCVLCERAFMRALGGDCQSPIAAFAEIHGQNLKVTGMVATPDGRELIRDRMEGNIREAKSLGEQLAKQLLQHGAREILRACRK
jgi:hydroxymethylbilane synthase